MWKRLEEAGGFLYRNRQKVATGAAVIVAVGALAGVYYVLNHQNSSHEGDEEQHAALGSIERAPREQRRPQTLSEKMRRLSRIQEEYERSLQMFIPTLHVKIVEVVDVNSTISRIKQLRARRSDALDSAADAGASNETEDELWEEIKVSSFSLLFVSAYVVCILSVLLRVQLHLLAGSSRHADTREDSGRRVIEGTYKHLFEHGIEALHQRVLVIAKERLAEWRVRDKLTVDYSELVRLLNEMRSQLDGPTLGPLLTSLLIPPEDAPADELSSRVLYQIWDTVESPVFAMMVSGAVNTCFQKVNLLLQRHVFYSDNPIGHMDGRSPPLASLLPQLKAISHKLVPREGAHLATLAKEFATGPGIDSFCVSILETS